MKCFEIEFSELAKDYHLRNDEKYHIFSSIFNWNLFASRKNYLIPLKEILEDDYRQFKFEDGFEYKGIPTGQSYLDEDGEIIDFQPVSLDDCPDRLKYKATKENILISSLRLAKSPALNFENLNDLENYVFSNGFFIFKVKENWNKKFILHLLRSKKVKDVLDNHIYRGIGISAYKSEDLLKIRIPLTTKIIQDQIVAKIEPIEQKIKNLKTQIKKPQEVINKVFAREFGFDLEGFERSQLIKDYFVDLSDFANNKDIRQSVKFHRPVGKFVLEELNKITNKRIKDFILEPIVLGSGISPKDFDETGNYSYVGMSNIKNWCLDTDSLTSVSKEFEDGNKKKTIAENDILIARSGEGTIGKCALIEDIPKHKSILLTNSN